MTGVISVGVPANLLGLAEAAGDAACAALAGVAADGASTFSAAFTIWTFGAALGVAAALLLDAASLEAKGSQSSPAASSEPGLAAANCVEFDSMLRR